MSGTTEPVLVEGLDPVLLIRLFYDADSISAAGDAALAQGVETAAAGATLEGSQYEPILGTEAPAGGAAPVNVTVPAVTQAADTLSCTMGTWDGEPTSYAYAWSLDGTSIPGTGATLPVVAADAGSTATCIVTATNAAGSTAAPPSNGVVVVAPP
jgi:hypothetical protein